MTLSGCASGPPLLPELVDAPARLELDATPFFPQQEYQCGPAALAAVLVDSGVAVQPATLADQVYLPARQGSLQVELLAATRRAGRVPYLLDPKPGALFTELVAGRPVLVLQNLAFSMLPAWHYAVVIGFDTERDEIILRSGTERRRVEQIGLFLRSWRLADHWGMVALRPGELPGGADPQQYLRAAALAEPSLSPAARRAVYGAALQRWPGNVTAGFGYAFAWQAEGELGHAETAYRQLLATHPRHAAARNNLAGVLSARGCYGAARAEATRALDLAIENSPALIEAIRDTLQGIPSRPDGKSCPGTASRSEAAP